MPPRHRAALGPASAVTLTSLPDDLIVRCLAPLSLEKRLQDVALVSKRFRSLCLAPQLLQSIELATDEDEPDRAVQRLSALLQFLLPHGQHVQRLVLAVGAEVEEEDEEEEEAAVKCAVDHALLMSCLVACSALSTNLQDLNVRCYGRLPSAAWLPGLTALHRLELGVYQLPLHLPAGISRLQALACASLGGWPITVEAGARLPASLTRLRLSDGASEQMLHQVSQLAALERLELNSCSYTADGMQPLSSLQQLTSLSLESCISAPSCLSMLTRLERLVVERVQEPSSTATLDAALGHLQQLTTLYLVSRDLSLIPPAITSLSRLQRLGVVTPGSAPPGGSDSNLFLPGGEWLASLRCLGLPWGTLHAAVHAGVLAGAVQLELLCSTSHPRIPRVPLPDHARWAQFWRFVATHPPLRCLIVQPMYVEEDTTSSNQCIPLFECMLRLQRCRPTLELLRTSTFDILNFATVILADGPLQCPKASTPF